MLTIFFPSFSSLDKIRKPDDFTFENGKLIVYTVNCINRLLKILFDRLINNEKELKQQKQSIDKSISQLIKLNGNNFDNRIIIFQAKSPKQS